MNIEQIKQDYINKVKQVDIVKDVLIQGDIITTVIEAPPWEDSYRKPIYDAQLEAYRQMEPGDNLDFEIQNILEERN